MGDVFVVTTLQLRLGILTNNNMLVGHANLG